MPNARDTKIVQLTVSFPSWLRKTLEEESSRNARSLSGEIVSRLCRTFGRLPNGEQADSVEGSAS